MNAFDVQRIWRMFTRSERGHDPDTPVRAIRRYDWRDQEDYTESTLSELFEDPVIRRLMTSDGVDPGELRALFADLRARLARDEASPGDVGQI
jgi:hypothetical protein